MKRFLPVFFILFIGSYMSYADPVSLYETGKKYQDREDWYHAIENYQSALQENPSYNLAFQGLAECFYALGEYEQALVNVTTAETFRKNDPSLMDLHAFILIGLGKIDESAQLFRQVLGIWPNDINARFGLAEIEISAGRIQSAADAYLDALKRNPQNRKALLSLALVNKELGNTAVAREYIQKALQYHGDDPEVFYYAAYLSAQDGQTGEAEKRVRSALSLRPDYDEAQELLASVLYTEGRYTEVLTICNDRISADRNSPSAWYMRTLVLEKQGQYEAALKSAKAGLDISPDDEILRTLAENILIREFSFEDSRRSDWAKWHADRGTVYAQKNLSEQALYEYRRVLKINPYDVDSRQVYAKLFLTRGYPLQYLEQLEFIQSLGKSTIAVNDAVESYQKLLATSVSSRWKIDSLYLDKGHTRIGIFYQQDSKNVLHPDSCRVTAAMFTEAFSNEPGFSVKLYDTAVASYSEAFRASREAGDDYFALIRFNENDRDMEIKLDMYVSRTGSKADSFTVFRTGNDRYANAIRRLLGVVSAAMPVRGVLLSRYQAQACIDLGKIDGIQKDQKFNVIRQNTIAVSNEGIGLTYDKDNILGTFIVTTVGEEVSEGKLERNGFFDRMNIGDTVILKPDDAEKPQQETVSVSTRNSPALLSLLEKIK